MSGNEPQLDLHTFVVGQASELREEGAKRALPRVLATHLPHAANSHAATCEGRCDPRVNKSRYIFREVAPILDQLANGILRQVIKHVFLTCTWHRLTVSCFVI